MRRLYLLCGIVLLSLVTFKPSFAAPLRSWSYYVNFAEDDYGWTMATGAEACATYTPGIGWGPRAQCEQDRVFIRLDYPEQLAAGLHFTIHTSAPWQCGTGSGAIFFAPYTDIEDGYGPYAVSKTTNVYPWPEGPTGMVSSWIELGIECNDTVTTFQGYIVGVTVTGTTASPPDLFGSSTDYYKPVTLTDTLEILSPPNVDHLVTTQLDANIFASISGDITTAQVTSNGYRAIITATDGTRAIYNNLSVLYVSINDPVLAGCVIGQAGSQFANTVDSYEYTISQITFDVRDDDVQLDWSEWANPSAAIPCGDLVGNCVNRNPAISDNAQGWNRYDSFLRENSIVVYDDSIMLDWDDSIYQTVVLDDPNGWYVTLTLTQVNIQLQHEYPYSVEVTLGDDTIDQSYGPVQALTQELVTVGPLSPTEYDYPPDMYNLRIRNSNPASHGMIVDYACLHQNTISITNEYCYFDNWDFGDGDTSWDSDVGADWRKNALGPDYHVWLDADEWISQAVSLLPYEEDDCTYKLSVRARVGGNDLGDLDDIFVSGFETTFNQQVMDGEVEELDIGDVEINNIVIFMTQVTEFTVEDDDTLDGDLVITNDTASTKSLDIDSVCIMPVTGIWPGAEDDDLTLVQPTCANCSAPDSINPVEWLAYFICVVRRFWSCELMVSINSVGKTIFAIINGIGYLGRWLSAVFYSFGQYLLALLSELAALLLDLMLGALASLWNWIAALQIMRSLYDLITIALYILTQTGAAVDSALDFVLAIVQVLGTLADILAGFKDALFAAVNSSTVADVSLPNCLDTNDPLYAFCIGLQLVETVIDEFPTAAASIYVVAGCLGIVTMIHTVRELGEAAGGV